MIKKWNICFLQVQHCEDRMEIQRWTWHFLLFCLLLRVTHITGSSWTAEVPRSVSALLGSCVVIPCSFNYPEPGARSLEFTGIWAKDTQIIYHPDRSNVIQDYKGRTDLVGDLRLKNCSLRIDPLHASDEGPFYFRIEIDNYDRYSFRHSTVSIAIKSDPEPPSLSVSEVVRVGEAVLASCSVSHSCPSDPPHLTWSHSGTPTVQSQQQTDGQWEVTSSLTFAPTLADHKKPLICTAAYRPGGKKGERSKLLNVQYPPVAVKAEGQTTVKEGHSVELKCSSNSNPAAHSYQWHTSSGALQSQEQTYRLERVSRHTQALYCTAFNTEGQGLSSPVQFNVLYPPEITVGSACSSDTSTVTCLCIVDSVPPSEIQWSLPDGPLFSSKEERNSSLTIATLQAALSTTDKALCHASNTQGNVTLAFTLPTTNKMLVICIGIGISAFVMAVILVSVCMLTKKCRGRGDGQPAAQDMAAARETTSDSATKQVGKETNSGFVTNNYTNDHVYGNEHVYGNMEVEAESDTYDCVLGEDGEESIYANV